MPDNSVNLNIFSGGETSFLQALPAFSGIAEFALPIKVETAGAAALYSIQPFIESEKSYLTVFTDARLLNPPLIKRPALEAVLTLFHAPKNDLFMFNAPHPQASARLTPLRASRSDLSLLAGFLTSGAKTGEDPSVQAAAEFALGRLHGAHYFYALISARNPASRTRLALGTVLIELGLLQEAYTLMKDEKDPEALLNLAVIHRRAGNPQAAREMLAAIAPGTPLEDRKTAEKAWLDLEAGKEEEAEKAFERLTTSAFDKTDALSGMSAAIAKTAFRTRDKGRVAAAAAALRSALVAPSPATGRVFFQLGNLYFRSGDVEQAEACYRSSSAIAPAIQAMANLALTLIRTGKNAEAAAVTQRVALTDIGSAARLVAEFPKDKITELFPQPKQAAAANSPAANSPAANSPAANSPAANSPAANSPAANSPATPPPAALSGGGASADMRPAATAAETAPPAPAPTDQPAGMETASLAPAQPQSPPVSGRRAAAPPMELKIETLRDSISAPTAPTEAESRKDDFISRAFKLASELEDELGKKVYFNQDGLSEAEKTLRLTFLKARANPQAKIELVRDCAAFLCYFLQERHKGRLIKMADFDPWGWPMLFEAPGMKMTTYPVQRVWRLLWEEAVPEPGWLTKYSAWVAGRVRELAAPPYGLAAARSKIRSHPERLTDVAAEHKRIMILNSSLPETADIEIGHPGIIKLDAAIKSNFKPDTPPTNDGWKLLRCYGHILAEILSKDFKAVWFNGDGEDGGWSMQMPWKTIVFPLGKVYKTAANRGDLGEYYEELLSEKLRLQGGPQAR